ncbi:MAG: hypothetical protein NC489_35735 [Ruminococcus flavefaciens]|nr:hypothetical protein [Ruminococcus flavefaciens]
MAIKYFLYSPTQMKFRKQVEEKMGKRFRVGTVIVNGVRKPFTELSSTKTSRYADAIVVTEMDTDSDTAPKYEMPEGR